MCDTVLRFVVYHPALYLCITISNIAVLGSFMVFILNKLLLISFDGFRWDYDRDVETPNLDKMAWDGVKALYATPAFLTITSPSHFTMLTGRYIENHGVIHNMWFNTTTQEKKQYYMTQFLSNYYLPTSKMSPGLKAVEPHFYDHSNESEWRVNIDKVIDEWFHQQDLDFVSLYFGEPDLIGHTYGPDSPERKEMVRQVDRTVGYIRDKIQDHGLTDRLNVIMTADHGMTTVLRSGQVEEIILSKIPGFSFKDIQFQLLDYGPLGMLLPKEGMLEKVYQALKGSHPHLHVYKKEDMPERLHYSKHPRLLPIILIADPGYIVNGFFPVHFNKGEHGFDNEAMDMKAFFRAVGPDFQSDLMVGPFDLVDLYPLMCHLLGIKPEIHDGHLNKSKDMLVPQQPQEETMVVSVHTLVLLIHCCESKCEKYLLLTLTKSTIERRLVVDTIFTENSDCVEAHSNNEDQQKISGNTVAAVNRRQTAINQSCSGGAPKLIP
uniref:Ectonucleotide pyrophosphatase/phosphodiesterase 7, tandem duplicate 2 n=1 Tax=Amphiprion percula TaxID=161767 RepID=A0A3P8TGQ8_AMPPE